MLLLMKFKCGVLRCIDGNPVQVIGGLLDWLDVSSASGHDLLP